MRGTAPRRTEAPNRFGRSKSPSLFQQRRLASATHSRGRLCHIPVPAITVFKSQNRFDDNSIPESFTHTQWLRRRSTHSAVIAIRKIANKPERSLPDAQRSARSIRDNRRSRRSIRSGNWSTW